MFGIFKKQKKIGGDIGYYNLQDWWLNELTSHEREVIEATYKPMGGNGITEGEIYSKSSSVVSFLSTLSTWFQSKENRDIANKILNKAESLIDNQSNVLDKHFLYSQQIEIFYKDRENKESLHKAIEACKKQIAISEEAKEAWLSKYSDSLPSHNGYYQLSIIYDKQGKIKEAIEILEKCINQGWTDKSNEKRLEKLKKKLEK